jgi:hypothetical protein
MKKDFSRFDRRDDRLIYEKNVEEEKFNNFVLPYPCGIDYSDKPF